MDDALIETLVNNRQIRKITYGYEFLSALLFLVKEVQERRIKMTTTLPEDLTVVRVVQGEDAVVLYAVSKTFGALPPGSLIPAFDVKFEENAIAHGTK